MRWFGALAVSRRDVSHMVDYATARTTVRIGPRVLRRVMGCFRPYRGLLAASVVALLVSNLLQLVPPLLIRGVLDDGIPAGRAIAATRPDGFAAASPLLPYVAGMLLIPLLAGVIGLGQRYLSERIGLGVMADLRGRLFTHLQNQSLRF